MRLCTGIDIVPVDRIRKASIDRRFLERVFTGEELRCSLGKRDPSFKLARVFAAKEAFLKAVSTGLANGMRWRDIEVLERDGRAELVLRAKALDALGRRKAFLACSSTRDLAVALVVLEGS